MTVHAISRWRGRTARSVAARYLAGLIFLAGPSPLYAARGTAQAAGQVSGKVLDLQGSAVANAHVRLNAPAGTLLADTTTDSQGNFQFEAVEPGAYHLIAEAPSFAPVALDVSVVDGQEQAVTLQFQQLASVSQSVTVFGSSTSVLAPDTSERVVVHDQVLDANPGRPGAPISIPGLPIETASGGIKAPQYFAPGVAGDHGEPIAQFFQIGNFLYPNNLPANAHGNGYSDPNFLIAPIIDAVTVDGGAFNVREGNHSVDLAATYVPRSRVGSFIELTGDYRDADLVAAWGSRNAATDAWIAVEASFGNGFLERLEHRQQYKVNAYREFKFGRHDLTLFGVGYYGFSFVPGLIPTHTFVPDDTVDNRQLDRTNTVDSCWQRHMEPQQWPAVDLSRLFSGIRTVATIQLQSRLYRAARDRRADPAERNADRRGRRPFVHAQAALVDHAARRTRPSPRRATKSGPAKRRRRGDIQLGHQQQPHAFVRRAVCFARRNAHRLPSLRRWHSPRRSADG